jgi:predicted permease
MMARLQALWRNIVHRTRIEAELDEEVRTTYEMLVDEKLRTGMPVAEARRLAAADFGGIEPVKERVREVRVGAWLEDLARDLAYALRGIRRSPGFAAVSIATLALGIGANTAVFSMVDGAVLHPIPFPDADRLVAIYGTSKKATKNAISYQNFLDWQRQTHTFDELAAWRTETFTLSGSGRAEQLAGVMVSSSFFPLLQIPPIAGRVFTADEDRRGQAPVAVIGEGLWERRFGRDLRIIGQPLALNGRSYTVIGVMPARVRIDRVDRNTFNNDVFVPIGLYEDPLFLMRGTAAGTLGIGRLKPDVSIARAQADIDVVTANLARAYPEANNGVGANLVDLREDLVGDVRPILWTLLAAVGFVLLIACANVSNLALARSLGRAQEFAVRGAIGASRGRLIRQLLAESLLLTAIGTAIGIGLAAWTMKAALAALPPVLPAMSDVTLNWRVLIVALGVSAATGVLFGLAPARYASRPDLNEQLKTRGTDTSGQAHVQRMLVVVQMALTLVLLVGTGLMVRSLMNVWNIKIGFDTAHVAIASTGLSADRRARPDTMRASLADLNQRLLEIPDVESASLTVASVPFGANTTLGFWPADDPRPSAAGDLHTAMYYAVGADYFRTMSIPVLRGRVFTEQDDTHHPTIVVVDQQLAVSTFGTLDVIGKQLRNGFDQTLEIVGVVGHIAHRDIDKDASATLSELYVPYRQLPDAATALFGNFVSIVVRSPMASQSLFSAIREVVGGFDPSIAVHDERTMNDAISATLDGRRFSLAVLGLFAVTALTLATIGIYGVVSYGVTRRTRDIGIRLALGASPTHILTRVLGEAGRLTLIGTVVGLAGSLVVTRLLSSLLFRVSPFDPLTLAGVSALVLLVTFAACYIPARRATRVDPLVALRCE